MTAYYKKIYGGNILPIQTTFNYNDLDLEVNISHGEGEFLINRYTINNNYKVYLTSRRLVIANENEKVTIRYKDIDGIFLAVPFKKQAHIHTLYIVIHGIKLLPIEFTDLQSLVDARNEIYRIINTVILNWVGAKFNVNNIDFDNLQIVSLKDYKFLHLPSTGL